MRSTAEVHLGQSVSADDIVQAGPDAVVVATGGHVAVPAIPGAELPHVNTEAGLRELLGGWRQRLMRMPVGRRVAIIGGDLVALQLAEFLARRGRVVSILQAGKDIAPEVGNKRKTEHMDRLDRLGVTVHVHAPVERITTQAVVFTPAGGTARQLAADSVVIAGTVEPDTTLFDTLVATMPGAEVHAAGDCSGLGLIRKATEEGARAACAI